MDPYGHNEREVAFVMELCRGLYDIVASALPHTTTLGQIRVLTEIVVAHLEHREITVGEIACRLKMPRSTVSRLVIGFSADGVLTEVAHTLDARKHCVQFTNNSHEENSWFVSEVWSLIDRLQEEYCELWIPPKRGGRVPPVSKVDS